MAMIGKQSAMAAILLFLGACFSAPSGASQPSANRFVYRCVSQNGVVTYSSLGKTGCKVLFSYQPRKQPVTTHRVSAVGLYSHGDPCTVDCSGHQAGYDWAEVQGIDNPDDCGGNSQSFIEGCEEYATEQEESKAAEHEDDSECNAEPESCD